MTKGTSYVNNWIKAEKNAMVKIEVTEKQKKLIELLNTIPYGEVLIFQENFEPVRVVQIKESVKL